MATQEELAELGLAREQAAGGTEPPAAEAAPEAPAEPTEPEAPPPPWEERGLGGIDDVWKSYTELERRFRERNDEVGQLRRFQEQALPILEQASRGMQQPESAPTHLPNGVPILSAEQMQELREVDPAAYADFAVQYRVFELEQRFESMVEERLGQRLAPLEKGHVDRGAQESINFLNATFGDDVIRRNGELVADLIRKDRAHYADLDHGGRRLAEAVALAEYQRSQGVEPARPQGAPAPRPVHMEGGSGAAPTDGPPQTAEDARRAFINELMGPAPAADAFGSPVGTDYNQ